MRHVLLFTTALLWACSSPEVPPPAASQPAPNPSAAAADPAAASPEAASPATSCEISITYCVP